MQFARRRDIDMTQGPIFSKMLVFVICLLHDLEKSDAAKA